MSSCVLFDCLEDSFIFNFFKRNVFVMLLSSCLPDNVQGKTDGTPFGITT